MVNSARACRIDKRGKGKAVARGCSIGKAKAVVRGQGKQRQGSEAKGRKQ